MNAGTNAAVIFAARTEEQIAEYFQEHRATSIQSAIHVDIRQLKKLLEAPEFLETPLEQYKFIRKTPDGRYYLDTHIYTRQQQLVKMIIIAIFIMMAFISLMSVLFGFFGFMTNS